MHSNLADPSSGISAARRCLMCSNLAALSAKAIFFFSKRVSASAEVSAFLLALLLSFLLERLSLFSSVVLAFHLALALSFIPI